MGKKSVMPGVGLEGAGEKPVAASHPILEILKIILAAVRIATLQAGSPEHRKTDRS
jgi:hypothetical protein